MSERLVQHKYEIPITDQDEWNFDHMVRLADEVVTHGRISDPVESKAMAIMLQELSPFGEAPWMSRTTGYLNAAYQGAFAIRRPMHQSVEAGYMLRLGLFTLDMLVEEMFPGYARDAHRAEFWYDNDVFGRLDYQRFYEELTGGELVSCMADAYAIYHIFTNAMGHRWGYEPTALDNGRSAGVSLKLWKEGGFRSPAVYKEPRSGQPIAPETLVPDGELQEEVDNLIAMKPAVGTIVGYDRVNIPIDPANPHYDKAIRRFRSHTFPMSESIRRADELREFNELISKKVQGVILPEESIKAEDPLSLAHIRRYLPAGKADVGIFSAMLFEQRDEIVRLIRDNQRHFYNPGSIIFETDFFARQDPKNPTEPKFVRRDWWHHPGTFATFGRDPHRPDLPPLELARFLDRRGSGMWLTEAGKRLIREGRLYD